MSSFIEIVSKLFHVNSHILLPQASSEAHVATHHSDRTISDGHSGYTMQRYYDAMIEPILLHRTCSSIIVNRRVVSVGGLAWRGNLNQCRPTHVDHVH